MSPVSSQKKKCKDAGYEYQLSPTWYEDYKSDEFTIFQPYVLRAKRLSIEELFYYQRMQYLATYLTTRRSTL